MSARWRWWARRAILLFAGVYVLGLMRVPTLIPYVAVVFVVIWDAVRTARSGD